MAEADQADELAESDPGALSSSEDLDEDQLSVDPLEEGMDPPEHWTAADRYGTTPAEQRAGEPLDARLGEERPDMPVEQVPDRPVAATPAVDLDELIDRAPADLDEPAAPEEGPASRHSDPDAPGRAADSAGGSVAAAIREPREGS